MTQQGNFKTRVTSQGLEFIDNSTNAVYLSTNDHRGNARASLKTEWTISQQEEYNLYLVSEARAQKCADGHLWGFLNKNGTEVLGTEDEVLAKFTGVSTWHGYPVCCKDTKPPVNFVRHLRDNLQVISRGFAQRIMNGKV